MLAAELVHLAVTMNRPEIPIALHICMKQAVENYGIGLLKQPPCSTVHCRKLVARELQKEVSYPLLVAIYISLRDAGKSSHLERVEMIFLSKRNLLATMCTCGLQNDRRDK